MTENKLYDYLLHAADRNLVITFDDSDQYDLANVDLCYSTGYDGNREHEPLHVSFIDCRNSSNKRKQAIADGNRKTPGVYWTSTEPTEPMSMDYTVADIIKIWDDEKQYYVYNPD